MGVRDIGDAQGPFATMDIELWALVFDRVDRLSLPCLFFVSRRLCAAVRRCRLARDASAHADDDEHGGWGTRVCLPAYAVHYDYVASLIEARRPAIVQWAVDDIGCEMPPGMCRRIAATGDIALLKWARTDKGCLWDARVFYAALASGCIAMAQWLVDNGCPWRVDYLFDIPHHKPISEDMLLWLLEACRLDGDTRPTGFTDVAVSPRRSMHIQDATIAAVCMGHVKALDWLWRRHASALRDLLSNKWSGGRTVHYAGHVEDATARRDTIRWLVDHGWSYTPEIFRHLARHGDLETLMWLRSRRESRHTDHSWSDALYRRTAACGHVHIIDWLDAVGVPWDPSACSSAARAGHLDVIKWAKMKGHSWRDGICDAASRGSRLGVLVWAHEKHGCPWSDRARHKACTWAAKNNRLDAMQWAFARGSLITGKTAINAVRHGCVATLDWIDAHATIHWPSYHFLCGEALLRADLDIIAWLRKRGVPWSHWHELSCGVPAVMRRAIADHGCPLEGGMCADAAKKGDLEMLMWLRARECPWDSRVCEYAAQGGHLAVLRWATTQGCDWDSMIQYQARGADPEVVEWIAQQDNQLHQAETYYSDDLKAMLARIVDDPTTAGNEWMPLLENNGDDDADADAVDDGQHGQR
ncbi:hypothetical protein pkur_cds_367 [Pandoravirus kuranda]|uniref:Ankyrin repeat domain containing protein n=1 Tax=Pandoravirus kuranda TaxID=3019033 RepID=A0AA95ED23_9VIRU|nr:hypothetical protein pkur_cds_367 [Pandoravirus kuranda]